MKPLQDVYGFFMEQLVPDLSILEAKRKTLVQNIYFVGVVIVCIAIFVIMIGFEPSDGQIVFPAIFVGGASIVFMVGMMSSGYRSEFKDKVIKRLISFLDPGLSYDPVGYVTRPQFEASSIFLQHIDDYKGDDLVRGRMGETAMEFSELHAQYETHDSKGRTQHHTIFKGLFYIADFNKDFKGKTVVLPDTAERMLGGLGTMFQKMNVMRGQLIKLEDPAFEKEFVVYGSDQVEARYILSPSLMQRITAYKKKTNKSIHMSFAGSKVYVAISYGKDLFEPRIFRTMLSFKPIEEYYEDLNCVISIVDELNLNTRIWSKE